jgi:hypothetical protein
LKHRHKKTISDETTLANICSRSRSSNNYIASNQRIMTDTDAPALKATARTLYRERRLRARHFAGDLFAEPMWDMLLDLYIADCERRRITVKSVCIGADVPATTALRHLSWLHEQGLVERLSHPRDARST